MMPKKSFVLLILILALSACGGNTHVFSTPPASITPETDENVCELAQQQQVPTETIAIPGGKLRFWPDLKNTTLYESSLNGNESTQYAVNEYKEQDTVNRQKNEEVTITNSGTNFTVTGKYNYAIINGINPTLSPNGQKIAFSCWISASQTTVVVVMNLNRTKITVIGQGIATHKVLGPLSDYIAFDDSIKTAEPITVCQIEGKGCVTLALKGVLHSWV